MELIIAALGGLTGALPARAEEESKKVSQIATAYQSTQNVVQLRPSARSSSDRGVARW
jgi:hypothetical protein